MVDADLVASKLSDLAHRVARARARVPATPDLLAQDEDAKDVVALNLMIAVQTCADVAMHLIADEHWPPARSTADAFRRIAEKGVIAMTTAQQLARAVGLRNVVAHGYGGLDVAMLHAAATTGVGDLDLFAREVATWLATRAPSP